MLLAMEKKFRVMQLAWPQKKVIKANTPDKKYKRSGYDTLQLLMYGLGALVLMAVAIMAWPSIRDFIRSTSQSMELNNMRSAAAAYSSLRLDSAAPTSASDLIDGIEATDAVDGRKHDGFMTAKSGRWQNGTYTDEWGQDFTFGTDTDGNNYITSNGPDQTYGTDDDITVYY